MPILAEIIGPDLLIVLALALLLFGGSKLPQLARSLGSAKSEFEKGLRETDSAPAATTAAPPDTSVTMTRGELDALLAAEREAVKKRKAIAPPEA